MENGHWKNVEAIAQVSEPILLEWCKTTKFLLSSKFGINVNFFFLFENKYLEHCAWSAWSEWTWSDPVNSCGNGRRTRRILKEAKYGGYPCRGRSTEGKTRPCNGT